jgi:hypothetical protein
LVTSLETRGVFEEIGRPIVWRFEFAGESAMADNGDTAGPSIARTRLTLKHALIIAAGDGITESLFLAHGKEVL